MWSPYIGGGYLADMLNSRWNLNNKLDEWTARKPIIFSLSLEPMRNLIPIWKSLAFFAMHAKCKLRYPQYQIASKYFKTKYNYFSLSRKQPQVNLLMLENTLHARRSNLVILFKRHLSLYTCFLHYYRRSIHVCHQGNYRVGCLYL